MKKSLLVLSIVGASGTTPVFQELGSAANDAAAYSTSP
jgi:hypothetical protein